MNKLNTNTQTGVTLVFSLVILVTLTLLGITSFQNTRTEISMAGNLRESGLTFNAAEAGLSAAERFIGTQTTSTAFTDNSVGLYDDTDADPNYGDHIFWNALAVNTSISLPHVSEQPKYVIRYLGDRSENEVATVNIGGYGSSQPGITVSNFRVTAQGTGQSGNIRRYVQSYYGKEF